MSLTRTQFRLGTVRGIVLTVSIGLFAILFPLTGSDAGGGLVLGVALQLFWWLAMWLATRYEDEHQLAGFLKPVVALVVELVIDAITVGLFAYAVFRNWWGAAQTL